MNDAVRTRFAPSPTGYMHLGNAWIALLNWLWTRQHNGTVVLRIEDIDRKRCRDEYASAIMEDLQWLGLDWDEGPAYQSSRMDFYRSILEKWESEGDIYPCYCSRARLADIASAPHEGEAVHIYDGHCRNMSPEERRQQTKMPSWRMKTGAADVRFTDMACGVQARTMVPGKDDFVVLRADGMIAYQLAAAADDGDMGITHIIRGNDLWKSSFAQTYILKRLGFRVPYTWHMPLLVDENGIRLSKRQGGITLRDMRERGICPDEIIGALLYMAGAQTKNEPVSLSEAVHDAFLENGILMKKKHIALHCGENTGSVKMNELFP